MHVEHSLKQAVHVSPLASGVFPKYPVLQTHWPRLFTAALLSTQLVHTPAPVHSKHRLEQAMHNMPAAYCPTSQAQDKAVTCIVHEPVLQEQSKAVFPVQPVLESGQETPLEFFEGLNTVEMQPVPW